MTKNKKSQQVNNETIKLTKSKKTGKRYITYKKKRYLLNSKLSDKEIYKNLFQIIYELIKQRQRKRKLNVEKAKKSTENQNLSTTLVTSAPLIDENTINKLKSYEESNKNKEINTTQKLLTLTSNLLANNIINNPKKIDELPISNDNKYTK